MVKRFEVRFHQKTTSDSSRPAVDWKIRADAVSEAISSDSGEKVLSFRQMTYESLAPFRRNRMRLPRKQRHHECSSRTNRQLVKRNRASSSGGTELRISSLNTLTRNGTLAILRPDCRWPMQFDLELYPFLTGQLSVCPVPQDPLARNQQVCGPACLPSGPNFNTSLRMSCPGCAHLSSRLTLSLTHTHTSVVLVPLLSVVSALQRPHGSPVTGPKLIPGLEEATKLFTTQRVAQSTRKSMMRMRQFRDSRPSPSLPLTCCLRHINMLSVAARLARSRSTQMLSPPSATHLDKCDPPPTNNEARLKYTHTDRCGSQSPRGRRPSRSGSRTGPLPSGFTQQAGQFILAPRVGGRLHQKECDCSQTQTLPDSPRNPPNRMHTHKQTHMYIRAMCVNPTSPSGPISLGSPHPYTCSRRLPLLPVARLCLSSSTATRPLSPQLPAYNVPEPTRSMSPKSQSKSVCRLILRPVRVITHSSHDSVQSEAAICLYLQQKRAPMSLLPAITC
ncbi:unnamed protein product [Protopolystoma xenopodis]|uniref:Uncharacterized protein n=1 Tax=Protopolystoma xenopodis TaxID=117903 RepID=A0A448XG43_9PLAT|nr:unnamed protein product [Protopolystoma xenopodis]